MTYGKQGLVIQGISKLGTVYCLAFRPYSILIGSMNK